MYLSIYLSIVGDENPAAKVLVEMSKYISRYTTMYHHKFLFPPFSLLITENLLFNSTYRLFNYDI